MDIDFNLGEPHKPKRNSNKTQTFVGMRMLTALAAVLQVFARAYADIIKFNLPRVQGRFLFLI